MYIFFWQKLNELEKEEDIRFESGFYDHKVPVLSEQMKEIYDLARQIREKQVIIKDESRVNKASTKPIMPRTAGAKVRGRSVTRLRKELGELGVDMEDTEDVSYPVLISKMDAFVH